MRLNKKVQISGPPKVRLNKKVQISGPPKLPPVNKVQISGPLKLPLVYKVQISGPLMLQSNKKVHISGPHKLRYSKGSKNGKIRRKFAVNSGPKTGFRDLFSRGLFRWLVLQYQKYPHSYGHVVVVIEVLTVYLNLRPSHDYTIIAWP